MKANCAAAAAVAATAKAYATDKPRSRGEFSSAKPPVDTKPTNPKNFCKPGSAKNKICQPPSGGGATQSETENKTANGNAAESSDTDDYTKSTKQSRVGSDTGSKVLSIKAQILINIEKDNGFNEPEREQCSGQAPCLCAPQQEEPQKQEQSQQGRECPGQGQRPSLQPSQQSLASKASGRKCEPKEPKEKPSRAPKESGQDLAAARYEMAKQLRKAGDSRPWYCDTPSFHESIRPKSQLSPTPSHAPFFQSAARFKTDKPAFKAPAPNAYLPPVMNKVRWSGILTGYHGIPTCYNIVDRNCDLSKVHMHCVMCPPRGIYSKSIGFPLNEIYPDDKVRDEQLRHMCSWHAGTIKRAYHDRGILAKGCTEGLQGRTEVGPPTIKSDNVGCACIRRSNLGTLDDVTLEKMAAALNSKKRDPDLSQPIALCQKFAKKELNTPEGNAAAKLAKAMEQAEECKKRCQEYTKKKEKEAEAAEKNALLAEAAKRKPFTPTSRPSRKGETAEPRLESVTEIVDESPRQTGKVCRESEMEEISKKSYTPRSSGAASSRMAKPPSIVSSRNSSRGAYDQQADFASEKSCATYQDSRCGCRDDGAVRDKTPRISADNGYPETINETSQEGTATESCGLQIRTASDATVRSSSMADGEETFSASSRRRSVVDNNAQDENCEITELNTEQQNVELNSQDCTGVGGNTFRPVVCPPIKIDCKCSLYNKGPSANGSQNGTQNAPQFGQPGYEPQGQQCAPSGQYGAQAQQYSAQYQQFGAKGQQQTCVQSQPQAFAQNQQQYYAQGQQQTFAQGQRQNCAQGQQQTFAQGQQYGAQGQQYGAQNQQIGAQNQQFGAQNQQFGAQNQQIGAQNQQYCAPGQQYGALNQSGQTYAARVKLCFPPVGQTAGTNTTQNCPQGQQYGQQGQQGFPETLVAHVCPFPSGVPPSSPKDPSQSSNTR